MGFREVDAILRQNGWVIVRITGSHYQYKKENCSFGAAVPRHCNRDISIGVLRKLEKGTGLSFRKR